MKKTVFIAELFLALTCACCSQPVIFHTIQHPAGDANKPPVDAPSRSKSNTTPDSQSITTPGANFDPSFRQSSSIENRYEFAPVPNRIVFMIDDSSSTVGRLNGAGDDPSFILRKAAVNAVVNEYDHSPILFAFGKFGAGRAKFYNLCSKCLGGRRYFGSALEIKTALNDYVSSPHHGGDTPYLPTLFAIENLIDLNPEPSYAVVFVSDGEPTDIQADSELQLDYDLAHLVRTTIDSSHAEKVGFNTLYFGPLPGSADDHWYQAEDAVQRLQLMAAAGRGRFYELRNK